MYLLTYLLVFCNLSRIPDVLWQSN